MISLFMNKADVLNFSAERLEAMAHDTRVALAVINFVKDQPIEGDSRYNAAVKEIKEIQDCPVNQVDIILSVARDLRKLALEEFASRPSPRRMCDGDFR